MSMIFANFLRRLGDFLSRNRAAVINWLLIVAAVVIAFFVIRYGIERIQQWSFERGVEAKDKEYRAAEAKVNAAEAVITALKVEMAAKDALLEELDKQYAVAKAAHGKTRTVYVSLKEQYEKTRDNPVLPACVSYADACKELAAAGYACK